MHYLLNLLVDLLVLLAYLPFFFQGPVVTVVIFLLWRCRVQRRNLSEPVVQSSGIARWREGSLYVGLILTTVATALDWISIVADYLERYPAATDPSTVESTEAVTKAVAGLCVIAVLLSIIGRGRCKAGTVITAALLLIASLQLMIMEGCRHMSF